MSAAKLLLTLVEALGSSLDLRLALERAYPALLRLVSADYAAFGVSDPTRPLAFDWIETNLPPAFFASYAEMAQHDFVRDAVIVRPGVVLRDQEMIDRRSLEQHPLYRKARALGAPMERVMAVMLPAEGVPLGGLALYRGRATAFADREQLHLQQLTRCLANTVHNCVMHQRLALAGLTGDTLIESQELATMVVAAPTRELARSAPTSALLEKWFTPEERLGRVPRPLADALAPFTAAAIVPGGAPARWTRALNDRLLSVSFIPMMNRSPRCWLLRFEVSVGAEWLGRLTARERQVLTIAEGGYDNKYIADELRCAVGTVKKHVTAILDKSGYASRAMLIARKDSR